MLLSNLSKSLGWGNRSGKQFRRKIVVIGLLSLATRWEVWIRRVAICGIWLSTVLDVNSVHAQTSSSMVWPEPIRISQDGSFANWPIIAADESGRIHVTWSQNVGYPELDKSITDTIFYSVKHGDDWSTPIDIFVSANRTSIRIYRIRSSRGNLHLLGTRGSEIFYAISPSANANTAHSWREISTLINASFADFVLDSNGTIHLIYTEPGGGMVIHTQSTNSGEEWIDTTVLWERADIGQAASQVRVEIDGSNTIHASWDIATASAGWQPVGVSYSRSNDEGRTWSPPLSIIGGLGEGEPSIGFDMDSGVHLVWNNPATTKSGRGHLWSMDGGNSWQDVTRINPGYGGRTGSVAMVQDSAGVLYLFSSADAPPLGVPRIFSTEWHNGTWETAQLLFGASPYEGENLAVAVSEGNRLHLIFASINNQLREYGIWYTTAQSSAPTALVSEAEHTTTEATAIPKTLSQIEPSIAPFFNVNVTIVSSTPRVAVWESSTPYVPRNNGASLVTSIASALTAVMLVAFARLIKTRRQ